jgi:NAD(P)H-hydrate epimerase
MALGLDRVRALVVGPGLGDGGKEAGPESTLGRLLSAAPVPAVVDADGLRAFPNPEVAAGVVKARSAPTVLTPHDGEYARLVGRPPGEDRIADVRAVAQQTGAVVLLKGSPTVVADPDGRVLLVSSGSARLATAGTGDVLSGAIGAFLARGLPALEAAAFAAHCHGRAAALGPAEGLVASDLPDLMSRWLSEVVG